MTSSDVVSFVKTADATLRVAGRSGEVGRTPLLLFNGIGASLELLAPFLDAVGPQIPSLRFDPPGIGGSPAPTWPYRFSGLARMANELCDRTGFGEVDVFGLSWGGAVAQEFTHRYPKRVRRLVLAATSTGTLAFPGELSAVLEMAGPLKHLRPGRKSGSGAGTIYGGDFRRIPGLAREFSEWFTGSSAAGFSFQMLAGAGWTSAHWLRGIRQPTLILAGEDDPLVPLANAKLLKALLPNARLVTYDCGHLFLLTRLPAASAEVREFLSSS